METLHRDFTPFTRINSWVDDLSQRTCGTAHIVADRVVECALGLVAGAAQLRLRISAKSVVQATSPQVLRTIQTKLADAGIVVQAVVAARDLGIDTTMGRKRAQKIATGRFVAGCWRAQRVECLTRVIKKAGKLARTGVKSQATWGHQAMGMAPTNLRAFKAQMAACTRARKLGGCVTTAMALQDGLAGDPDFYMRH